MIQYYRIEEMFTTGWELADPRDIKLTKEQAKEKLEYYLSEGISPSRLRAVPDND
jgi:hypothetical protein